LFVSISADEVAVVKQDGVVVGKISGFTTPRGLHFTEIDGEPTLLVADLRDQSAATPTGKIWKTGPEDIVPTP
jgi:hypothetical protein